MATPLHTHVVGAAAAKVAYADQKSFFAPHATFAANVRITVYVRRAQAAQPQTTELPTMLTLNEAISKAAKLLSLAKSSNANEAALAAQRAQEIMARYSIDAAMLSVDEGAAATDEPITKDSEALEYAQRIASWKPILATKVAKVNACRVFLHGSDIRIVGRASDVAKVRYLYGHLSGEVERLAKSLAKGMGRSYGVSFRMGAVTAIGEKLAEAHAKVAAEMRSEAAATGMGLVRIDNALAKLSQRDAAVDQWMRENMRLGSSRRSYSAGGGGYGAGYSAGQSVNVGGSARGALGTGQRKLA